MGVLLDRYKTKPMEPRLETMREGSPLYNTDKAMAIQPLASQPVEQPKVDSSNAIGSLAEILGPTPAEREAEERRLQKNRQQMLMWTGLFDGLRQLGNLYYTTKGAASQQFNSPYGVVNQEYQQQRQLYNDLANYRRNYATSLYNLRRQLNDDTRRNKLADAQANWYDSREEIARQKAELDKMKAARVIKMQDGSLIKFDPVSGTAEPLKEADPLYVEYKRSQINKNNRTGTGGSRRSKNNGTYGYTIRKHTDPATGDIVTTRTPTTGNEPDKAPADKRKSTTTVKKRKSKTRI